MKTIISLFVIGLLLSLAIPVQAQDTRVIQKNLGTVANSVDETGYVFFGDWDRVDSISISIAAIGEIDIDSLTLYKAVFDADEGKWYVDVSVLGNATVTLNLAATVDDLEQLYTSNATILTGASLRGINGLYYVTRGATAGNDATDPNEAVINFQIWGVRRYQ